MLKNKKIIALLLCLVILSQGASVMAASFTDVKKSGDSAWAYEYIMDLADKKIINGYPDGSYKPKGNVSILETISLLYGLMNPSQSEVNDALVKHKDYIKDTLTDVNWGQERVAYALEKGVVTKTDLNDAQKAGMLKNGTKINASRFSVSIMTARALGLEEKTSYNLTYKDLDKISNSRGLIAALIDTGVLHKDGIEGYFRPSENITRAQMAKMISVAYDWKAKNDKNLETKTESGKVVEVLDFDDYKSLVYTKEYANANTSAKVDKNTKITDKDGKTVEYKNLNNYKGAKATITFTGNHPDKKATEVKFTSDASYADGVFTFVSFRTDGKKNYIKLKDSKGNALDEVQILYDYAKDGNDQIKLNSLSAGTELDIEFVAGVVSEAKLHRGKTGEYKIESISGNTIRLVKNTKYGVSTVESYRIDNSTTIKRADGVKFYQSDLKAGQTIDITKRYNSSSDIIDTIVVYTDNYYNAQYTYDGSQGNRIYVYDYYAKKYTNFPMASSFTFNGKRYTSLSNSGISLYKNDKINLRFNRLNEVEEITTASYSYNNRVKANLKNYSTDSVTLTATNYRDQIIWSNSNVDFYINDRKVADFREVQNLLTFNRSRDVEATYVNGEVVAVYITTDYYNYNYNNRGVVTNIENRTEYYGSRYQNVTIKTYNGYQTIRINYYDNLYDKLSVNDDVYVSFNNYGEISSIERIR